MRKILFVISLVFSLPLFSQGLTTRYRGFGNIDYETYTGSGRMNGSGLGITTTHGYQINPHLFVGAGLGFIFTGDCKYGEVSGHPYLKRDSKTDVPLFFDLNISFLKKAITPFIDAKVGAIANDDFNACLALSAGCKFPVSDNMGLSIKVGFNERKASCGELNLIPGTKYNNYQSTFVYENEVQGIGGFSIGLSLDF